MRFNNKKKPFLKTPSNLQVYLTIAFYHRDSAISKYVIRALKHTIYTIRIKTLSKT